jgi:hypothetical protein
VTFRRAYDAIQASKPGIKGDVEYLRILHLAASTMEADVEQSLTALLADGTVLTADATKERCTQVMDSTYPPCVPTLEAPLVDLAAYDLLLEQVAS